MLAVESGVDRSYLVSASFLDLEVLSQPCSMKDSSSMAFTSHSESCFYTIRYLFYVKKSLPFEARLKQSSRLHLDRCNGWFRYLTRQKRNQHNLRLTVRAYEAKWLAAQCRNMTTNACTMYFAWHLMSEACQDERKYHRKLVADIACHCAMKSICQTHRSEALRNYRIFPWLIKCVIRRWCRATTLKLH